eukprot:s2_g46.t1
MFAAQGFARPGYIVVAELPDKGSFTSVEVTTKVLQSYDGRCSWFAYEDAIDDWCDITELDADKRAANVFLYRSQQFMNLHRGHGDMLRWITRFHLSMTRVQEACNDTYIPITDPNNPEVRAYVATLPDQKRQTITPEPAMKQANARRLEQHARTIPIAAKLVALVFVSWSELAQDQRQVLT